MTRLRHWLLALFFCAAGINHFVMPEFYLRMMPPSFPMPLEMVYLSGIVEILGGIGVLWLKTRMLARITLLLLLVAIFPANISMALRPEDFPEFSPEGLLIRLPFQFLFLLWVWWATQD